MVCNDLKMLPGEPPGGGTKSGDSRQFLGNLFRHEGVRHCYRWELRPNERWVEHLPCSKNHLFFVLRIGNRPVKLESPRLSMPWAALVEKYYWI